MVTVSKSSVLGQPFSFSGMIEGMTEGQAREDYDGATFTVGDTEWTHKNS